MNDFLFTAFKLLFFAIAILGLTLGTHLLTNYKDTLKKIFAKEKPKFKNASSLLIKTEESDKFSIYYIARLLAICVITFFLIIIFRCFQVFLNLN